MQELIIQNYNGVSGGETYRSTLNELDNGHSQIYASSLYVLLNDKGENITKPKNSDDKIVIGYTKTGMVFQIITDGFFGCERIAVFSFIENHVIPLMNKYSNELTLKSSTSATTALIKQIYDLHSHYGHNAEFTLSIAMTYLQDEKIRCAGFGIGDTAIAIKRTNGEIQQLVAHVAVDGFKDAFDPFSAVNPELIISRNTIFDVSVDSGDEIVGYTYMLPELETLTAEFTTTHIKATSPFQSQTVKHFALNSSLFTKDDALFAQLLNVVQIQHRALITKAQSAGIAQRFGDDFAVGSMKIPNLVLINKLKLHILSTWIVENIDAYINAHHTSRSFFNFFKDKLTLKAEIYKNLITHYNNYPLYLELIFLSLLASQENEALFTIFSADSEYVAKKDKVRSEWLATQRLFYSDLQIRHGDQNPAQLVIDIKTAEQIIINITKCINSKKDSEIDTDLTQIMNELETCKATHSAL